ncbi:hypothetical protein LCD36_01960 [Saccharopolyspora sp. 6T]|uniref:hypothetical protein n=1 Tax=Saccharopolyspora sp. 6T TaxID=2877238 RepID=UPI001CD2D0BC|nr:hypothetical protein [Saccharopolyspora sp. 6T]MCA1185206.1 hypothetical protein [Saccharopolyspora sp. 6T]
MPKAGDVGRHVAPSISPQWRQLVEQLKRLHRCAGGEHGITLSATAKRMEDRRFPVKAPMLSKVFSGRSFPAWGLVECLYRIARAEAGADDVGITLTELRQVFDQAAEGRCRRCSKHEKQVRELEGKEQECRTFHVDVRFGPPAGVRPAGVPVPPGEGDRQRSELAAVVERYAEEVVAARAAGKDEDVLALLGELPRHLDFKGVVACLEVFRRRREEALADTLLQLCGRGGADQQVLRLAIELQDAGFIADAGAVMKGALR